MNGQTDWDWGPWVKARVQHLGLKVGYLAYQLNTSRRTITRWLSRSDPPNLDKKSWQKLADLVKVAPNRLAYVHRQNDPTEAGVIVVTDKAKRRIVPRVTEDGDIVFEMSDELKHRYLCRDIGNIARGLSWHSLKSLWRYAVDLGQAEELPQADIEYLDDLGAELDSE